MEHLTAEALARLVDDVPTAEEAEHLASCRACAAELDALEAQTEALGDLPEILPPKGDWRVLEARLRSEGLIRDPGLFARLGVAETPGWMRAAAAVLLFLSGTGVGALATRGGTHAEPGSTTPAQFASLDDAATAVRAAEQRYMNTLTAYRQMLARDGADDSVEDARSRFAALEYLVAAGQAAVRQAPADPFLNGLLASTLAEREATLHRISSTDNWF